MGEKLAIGSINQAISFLGATGPSPRDPISPISNRRSAEPRASGNTAQPAESLETAYTIRLSQAALDRAEGVKGREEGETQNRSEKEQEVSARADLRLEKSQDPGEAVGPRAVAPSLPAAYRASNDNRSGGLLNLIA